MSSRRDFLQQTGLIAGAGIVTSLASSPASAAPLLDSYSSELRSQLLVPEGTLYLNTGSLGPSPKQVINAVVDALWTLERNPVAENWGELGQRMEAVREMVGNFIGAKASQVLLTRNTTEGLGLVCQSLPLQKGDEIVTTTLEHGGGEVGLDYLVKAKGAKQIKVELPLPPASPEQIVEVIEKALSPRTKLLMLSHVNTITGVCMPLRQISAITSSRGIYLLVDGAQAPGLVPVDVTSMGADAYASSGHKWLLGPKETGFLYLKNGFPGPVPPVFAFYGSEAYTQSSGTRNVASFIGLGRALGWHRRLGINESAAYCMELGRYCADRLKSVPGVRLLSSEHTALRTGIVSFSLPNRTNAEVYTRLKERNIIIKVLPQHNANRISCHVFVSRTDIDQFVTALTTLA